MGSTEYLGTPYDSTFAATAITQKYAKVGMEAEAASTAAKTINPTTDGAATFMFTFATDGTGKQALLEGYSTGHKDPNSGQYGSFNMMNTSSMDYVLVNKLMNDLLQIQLDGAKMYVRSFGHTSIMANNYGSLDKHPLANSINFVNYESATISKVGTYTGTTKPAVTDFVTVFVTTGEATKMGDVYEVTTTANSAAKSGKNCNYPKQYCTMEQTWAAISTGSGTNTTSRRLSTAEAKFGQAIERSLRKLSATVAAADIPYTTNSDTCDPATFSGTGRAGIPPIRKAQRLYALGRQQNTLNMGDAKAAAFSTCASDCCCGAYVNSSIGNCGSAATEFNPSSTPMALSHYDYFKGSMRNFGVFEGQLTTTEMDTIVTNLKLHPAKSPATAPGGGPTPAPAPGGGNDNDYWHICRDKFNESALSGNSSMTLAERMTASGCTTSSCVANTTECEEHSNSLLPIWHANPAGAELTCEIRQVKMEMRFQANASASAAELLACFTAGTCSSADLPSFDDLVALPGMAATGFNFTTDILKNLGKAVEYTRTSGNEPSLLLLKYDR